MNKVLLVGRLTRDPDIRTGNVTTARFSIAVDRRYKKEGDQVTADFPSCVAFGKTADFIDKYFHKGMRIGIEGRIQTGSYTNRDGQKVYTTDVICEAVEFVESKNSSSGNSGGGSQSAPPQTDADGFMAIPDGLEDEGLPF